MPWPVLFSIYLESPGAPKADKISRERCTPTEASLIAPMSPNATGSETAARERGRIISTHFEGDVNMMMQEAKEAWIFECLGPWSIFLSCIDGVSGVSMPWAT